MADIAERLRKLADRERPYGSLPDTLDEAAAEIERLRAALREIMGMDEVAIVEFKKGDGWLHQRVARAALETREAGVSSEGK